MQPDLLDIEWPFFLTRLPGMANLIGEYPKPILMSDSALQSNSKNNIQIREA